jgi:hypothetical protein
MIYMKNIFITFFVFLFISLSSNHLMATPTLGDCIQSFDETGDSSLIIDYLNDITRDLSPTGFPCCFQLGNLVLRIKTKIEELPTLNSKNLTEKQKAMDGLVSLIEDIRIFRQLSHPRLEE